MACYNAKEVKMMKDLTIIGGGPAGLSALIYACRANLDVLLIEKESLGGKLIKIDSIENYPGFKQISGFDLANDFIEHTKSFDYETRYADIKEIVDQKDYKQIILDNDEIINTKTIIIASGSKEKELELEHSKQYTGKGISYCAVCDGFFYRKKDVVIIGGGNSALQEALYLSQLVNSITIIIRRDVFRGDRLLVDKINHNEKIKVIKNVLPNKLIIEDDKLIGLEIKDKDNNLSIINCSGIFPYLGSIPNTSFLPKELLDENGYIKVNKDKSSAIKGIFAAGDVTDTNLRQVVTACSDGALAASSVIKFLQ